MKNLKDRVKRLNTYIRENPTEAATCVGIVFVCGVYYKWGFKAGQKAFDLDSIKLTREPVTDVQILKITANTGDVWDVYLDGLKEKLGCSC